MKHYAFEITASTVSACPVGKIIIDRTHKDDLWKAEDGVRLRTWHVWCPETHTSEWTSFTGKVIDRLCTQCLTIGPMIAAPHGHDGEHGPTAPRWAPDRAGVSS